MTTTQAVKCPGCGTPFIRRFDPGIPLGPYCSAACMTGDDLPTVEELAGALDDEDGATVAVYHDSGMVRIDACGQRIGFSRAALALLIGHLQIADDMAEEYELEQLAASDDE